MGWLVTFAVLFLLAIFPVGVGLRYQEEKTELRIRAAFLSIPLNLDKLLNKPKKEKKSKKKENPKEEPEIPPKPPQAKKKVSLKQMYADYKPLILLAVDFLGDLRRKLRIDHMDLNLILAGGDPCDLAVTYGRAWAAMGNLIPRLEEFLVIRKRDIQIQCDFTAEKTRVSARLDLHITLGRATVLIVGFGFRALRLLLNMKKRKGGALL